MIAFLKSLSPLRFVLLLSVIALIFAAPFAGEKNSYAGLADDDHCYFSGNGAHVFFHFAT